MTAEFTDKSAEFKDGVMLCLRPDNPERFVVENGTPVEEIHLTLLYFGKTDVFDASAAEQAKEVLGAEIAPEARHLRATVTAVTTFGCDDDAEAPLVLLIDAPGLAELQTKALQRLRSALGSNHQPYQNHGFMPHITVGYGASQAEKEFAHSLVGESILFDNIEFVWGTECSIWDFGETSQRGSISDLEDEFGLQLGGEIPDQRLVAGQTYAQETDGMANTNANEPLSADRDARLAVVEEFLAGPSTLEMVADGEAFAAMPVHHTKTTDSKDFDGDVVKVRTRREETSAYYGAIYAWHDSTGKPENKTTYRFPHHMVSETGDPGAAVDWACNAALMLIDDSGIPKGDYQGVYNHLAAHLKDAGLDVPDLGADNASVDTIAAAISTINAQFTATTTTEEEAMDAPFDVTNIEDTALIGEFIRRWVETVGTKTDSADELAEDVVEDEFAPKKGVNPFPPKKKDPNDDSEPDPNDPNEPKEDPKGEAPKEGDKPAEDKPAEDGDPEDKKEAPETPGEKPDPEDKAEAPEKKDNPFPPKAAAPAQDPNKDPEPDPQDPNEPKEDPAGEPVDPTKKKMIGQGTSSYEWEGVLIVEGIPSGDGRMIDAEALTWRELPVPLMLQTINAEGHSGAVICGSIHEVERVGQDIVGRGNFDSGAAGQEAKRLLTEGTMRGVSADIDSVVVDLRDSNGASVSMEDIMFGEASAMEVLVQGRIMGATLTPFPAFQEAHIEVLDNAAEDVSLVAAGATFEGEVWRFRSPYPICVFGVHEPIEVRALVASAGEQPVIPVAPPTEWFALREMEEPVPFTVYPDGRCFGLVAQFGSCHIGFRNKCVDVPRTMSNYRFFRNKRTLTAEGDMIATGPIFMDTVHPNLRLKASDAEAFYAHNGCAVADVALYENEWGIVAAGAMRSDATPEQIRRLRGSDISPDWRSIKGNLELVGLLGVNVSGFIVEGLAASAGAPTVAFESLTPRAQINIATDEVESLVAAGAMRECTTCTGGFGHANESTIVQILEMLSAHEAKLSELSNAVRPMRADRVFARAAELALGSSSLKDLPTE